MLKRTTGHVYAVDGVSFEIEQGETLGLVGESGCGKSTAGARHPAAAAGHRRQVIFDGIDVMAALARHLQRLRRDMQIVFQDPYASLNPRMKVSDIVGEPLRIHEIGTEAERKQPRARAARDGRPHRRARRPLSARVLRRAAAADRHRPGAGAQPGLIVCDEPVSALDVSIQAQIINLLEDLQERAQADLPVHRPRPGRGRAHLRPRGRHVPGQDRRGRRQRDAVRQAAAPLHRGAAVGRADTRPETERSAPAHHPRGRRAQPGEPAVGLPVPPALPAHAARPVHRPCRSSRAPATPATNHLVACHFPTRYGAGAGGTGAARGDHASSALRRHRRQACGGPNL